MVNPIRIEPRKHITQLFSRVLTDSELDEIEKYKKICNENIEQSDSSTAFLLTKDFAEMWSSNDNNHPRRYSYKRSDNAYPSEENIDVMHIEYNFYQEDAAMVYIQHSEPDIDPEALQIQSLPEIFLFLLKIENSVLPYFKQD